LPPAGGSMRETTAVILLDLALECERRMFSAQLILVDPKGFLGSDMVP